MEMSLRTKPNNHRLADVTVEFKNGIRKQYFDIAFIDSNDGVFLELYKPRPYNEGNGQLSLSYEMITMLDVRTIKRWYYEEHRQWKWSDGDVEIF